MTEDNSIHFFLANLSHELRNSLNGIIGYSQLLSTTRLDSTQKSYVNSMSTCCLQLVSLINDILDFSRLTAGKLQINNECFSIQEIIEEVNSVLVEKIKEKKQKLRYILDKNLPSCVILDRSKLIQILINLISNANKFTPAGGRIFVTIGSDNSHESSDTKISDPCLEFSIEDNGIGIPVEKQDKLFQPFFQAEENSQHGCGLGLSICKKLVDLLGGTISCQSSQGQGAVFKFSVKYDSYEEYQKIVEKNSKFLQGKFILISDEGISNADIRLLITDALYECNAKPVICPSAKETIRTLTTKRYPISVIIIDIDTVNVSLAKQLVNIVPEIPIIAISSQNTSINPGIFSRVILKPINKVKLIDILYQVLKNVDISSCELNSSADENDEKKSKNVSIMVAEDSSTNLTMLVKMLNSMGYTNITTAIDGQDVIEKLDQKIPDILLLDLKMPRKDGIEVAEYIKTKNFPIKTTIITASSKEEDKDRCKQLGIKYFLVKPVNMTQLKLVLTKMINGTGK